MSTDFRRVQHSPGFTKYIHINGKSLSLNAVCNKISPCTTTAALEPPAPGSPSWPKPSRPADATMLEGLRGVCLLLQEYLFAPPRGWGLLTSFSCHTGGEGGRQGQQEKRRDRGKIKNSKGMKVVQASRPPGFRPCG